MERLDDLITPRTKLLCLSHVSTRTGFVLPSREVADTAHKRGVPVLLDGAHAVGLIPVNVKELGCDFYSGCGHKWLLAPQGTGFLYVDADKLDDLADNVDRREQCPHMGRRHLRVRAAHDRRQVRVRHEGQGGVSVRCPRRSRWPRRSASRTSRPEAGNWPTMLRRRLTDVPGFTLRTPMDPVRSTGISTFDVGLDARDLTGRLWDEHRILVSGRDGELRVSIPYFALEEEIDSLVDVLSSLDRE